MALNKQQHDEIKQYLIRKIRGKLIKYTPETNSMPFHYRLLGKDRMALFSFIHSVNTMLGQSIFEHIGKLIAAHRTKKAIEQYKGLKGYISSQAVLKIDQILRDLRAAYRKPDKEKEIEPYDRWTLQGLFDLKQEVLVGDEFWDLLGGANTYVDLLKVFEEAGIELYDEINKK